MKDIKGYEGLYAVTSCGKVWGYKRKKFLALQTDKDGYKTVKLSKEGKVKRYLVHRLVAEAYILNSNELETVDHIDGDKTHNWARNLQWMTRESNVSKAKGKKVQCVETGEIFESAAAAGRAINRSRNNINPILNTNRTCGGYHWRRYNETV